MKHRLFLFLFAGLLFLSGCSGDKDKNIYKDYDRPKKPTEKKEAFSAPPYTMPWC